MNTLCMLAAATLLEPEDAQSLLLVAAGVVSLALYLLPGWIAFRRRKTNRIAILALDILAGWTFVGWVAALVWSLTEDRQ